jgi:hypothetical protein
MKQSIILFLALFLFTACEKEECEPEIITEVVTEYRYTATANCAINEINTDLDVTQAELLVNGVRHGGDHSIGTTISPGAIVQIKGKAAPNDTLRVHFRQFKNLLLVKDTVWVYSGNGVGQMPYTVPQ